MIEANLARQVGVEWREPLVGWHLPPPDPITRFFLGLVSGYEPIAAFGDVRAGRFLAVTGIETVDTLDGTGIVLCQRDLCWMDPRQLETFLQRAKGWDIAIAEPVRKRRERSERHDCWHHPYPEIFRAHGYAVPVWGTATSLVNRWYVGASRRALLSVRNRNWEPRRAAVVSGAGIHAIKRLLL